MQIKEHIISILVNNKPGVLSRVAGVFGRLGYNIESLCVAETIRPGISRITSVSKANDNLIEKTKKQLERLVDVVEVTEVEDPQSMHRELILIGINVSGERRADISQAIIMFGCRIIFWEQNYCIVEIAGSKQEVETALNYFKPLGIREIARTGAIALSKIGVE